MIKKGSFSFCILLFFSYCFGQQDPFFSQYMFLNSYFNPGASGIEGVTRATLVHQTTWLGWQPTYKEDGGAPHTQVLTADHPLKLFGSRVTNSGVGLLVSNDILGPTNNIQIKVSFAYHIRLKTGGTLGLGIRPGIYSYRILPNRYRAIDEEEIISDDVVSQVKPDLDLGIWYSTSKYFGGVSLSHVIPFGYNFSFQNYNTRLAPHLNINGAYNINLSGSLLLTPSILFLSDFSESHYDIGLMASINSLKYWGGISFKQYFTNQPSDEGGIQWITEGMAFKIGTTLLKDQSLRVGYALNWIMSGVSAKKPTSHELFISYVLPISSDNTAPITRSPRYRHDD